MYTKEQSRQMAKNMETGFLERMKTMDEKAFELYKKKFPLLKPFLSSMWWKAHHDPEFEISYAGVEEMVQKQYAYDQARMMEEGSEAMPVPNEMFDELLSEEKLEEIEVDKSFVTRFKKIEVEDAVIEDKTHLLHQKSERLWNDFNKKYREEHNDAIAFRFKDGKFFVVTEINLDNK